MTWRELFSADPGLAEAARHFLKATAPSLARARLSPFKGDGDVTSAGVLVLLLWSKFMIVELQYAESKEAEQAWSMLGVAGTEYGAVVYFKNRAGELVSLPEPFVRAFLDGIRLDAELIESEVDPSLVVLRRGTKVEATFPGSLLDFLVGASGRGGQRDLRELLRSHPKSRPSGTGKSH